MKWFWVNNKRDVCQFCAIGGQLLKNMHSGKCICPGCVKLVTEEMTK